MTRVLLTYIALLLLAGAAAAQGRNYAIHSRGTLHETIFNTGEIGRAYDQGGGGGVQGVPSMEWPGASEVIVDAVRYSGQYNAFGGGVQFAANPADTTVRIYSYCGAVGASAPDAVAGYYSFPLGLTRRENFPVLPGGAINPAYDPNEAEEIIVSTWSTPMGLTVTRTSRAWSFPDYDDFIIYEYEVQNTGNRHRDPATIESHAVLQDVLVGFAYGFVPSMFGYERTFNRWNYADYESQDLRARFDRRRWLNYTIDRNGKPDPHYFQPWAASGRFGGGLLSPQAVGFLPLYVDTLHLAHRGETRMQVTTSDNSLVWDENFHLKQPYLNRLETSNMRQSKIEPYYDVQQSRKNNPYRNMAIYGPDWVGRGSFNNRQSQKFGVGRILIFGPYTLAPGEKMRFAIAEVSGYGAARFEETMSGLQDEGGSCGELCGESADSAFHPVPNWTAPITYGGMAYGSNYLQTYPLPASVNSGVVTVREVADRAIQAYTGRPLMDHDSTQYWPWQAPASGVYQVPAPVPAPGLALSSTALAENRIIWGPHVESFTAPRLQGSFSHYELWKSSHPLGPWSRIDSIGRRDPRYFRDGGYTVIDPNTRVGESFYYAVVSVDNQGNRSGKTNMTLHRTQIGAAESLEKVFVVPNPFIVRAGWSGASTGGENNMRLGFYNLPKKCTIRIFSYSGQLVETLEHESDDYSMEYYQVTRNNQVIASGVYFYVVQTPEGKTVHGKFVVIH